MNEFEDLVGSRPLYFDALPNEENLGTSTHVRIIVSVVVSTANNYSSRTRET